MKDKIIRINIRNQSGITLIALIVTIVILLILAGITIMYVMGDNSIFKKASDAKLNTELAKIEEQASLIYADKLMQKAQENNLNEKITVQEVVEGLKDKEYIIEQVIVGENEITGISLDKERISIGKQKSNTIKVTIEEKNNPYIYYVKVDGKYYEMHFNNGLVTIDRNESKISSSGESKLPILTVSSSDETIATATIDNNTNTITVIATNKVGTVDIVVTCESYTKVCNVRVCDVATKLKINSVRARIATGYTRWLTATAEPEIASQEFEWTSSNTEIATVDNTGVITAKKKGATTITVKATDGSNLSKTCEVTVEDSLEITNLTNFQTENTIARDENGNLITVPGEFKVVTREATKVTQGIVIQDNEGNEFVWVPIDSVSKGSSERADDIRLGRYEFDAQNGTPQKKQDAINYTARVTIDEYCQELENTSGKDSNTPAKNLSDFITKAHTNGGYYLARYESSKGTDNKAKSQTNQAVWDDITQPDAAIAAREMYNSNYIESDLVNSYAWDTAIVFIQKYSGKSNYSNKSSVNTTKVKTGKSGDKVCNIHDMASNEFEWSTENSNSYSTQGALYWVSRGGKCGYDHITASKHSYGSNYFKDKRAFRTILYLKNGDKT